jgi:hypothetical protein
MDPTRALLNFLQIGGGMFRSWGAPNRQTLHNRFAWGVFSQGSSRRLFEFSNLAFCLSAAHSIRASPMPLKSSCCNWTWNICWPPRCNQSVIRFRRGQWPTTAAAARPGCPAVCPGSPIAIAIAVAIPAPHWHSPAGMGLPCSWLARTSVH